MPLDLYHLESCPYCRKVREYIAARELEPFIRYIEVSSDPQGQERLARLSGDTMVPVLVVDDAPMSESSRIIAWLGENEERVRREGGAGAQGKDSEQRSQARH